MSLDYLTTWLGMAYLRLLRGSAMHTNEGWQTLVGCEQKAKDLFTAVIDIGVHRRMHAAACMLSRYSDKVSQKAARAAGHREECKALRRMAPRLPPLIVRLAARVLWRRARRRHTPSQTCQQRAAQLPA